MFESLVRWNEKKKLDTLWTRKIKSLKGVRSWRWYSHSPIFFSLPLRYKILTKHFSLWNNFKWGVLSNPELLLSRSTMFCDWSWKLVSLCQPIKCKIKTNHDFTVARVFKYFELFGRFYILFLSPLKILIPSVLIGHCDSFGFGFTTLNQKALYNTRKSKSNAEICHRQIGERHK